LLFNSTKFLIFFNTIVFCYYLLPYKYRWLLLLGSSYYFYMSWNATYSLLIFFTTLVSYFTGLLIYKANGYKKKWLLTISLILILSPLIFFKYINFINETIKTLFSIVNFSIETISFDILLPVGISFYTFQAISYSVDIYRGEKKPERHFGIFALYISFFPQLVAGPIERSTKLLPQFRNKNKVRYENFSNGFKLIIWGYFLKLVVADRCSIYVDAVYGNPFSHTGLTFIIANFMFAFQIYGDFAGYSSIAIGTSRILGYRLMQNFNRPYFSDSFSNFWNRWHISLSTWFRDYFYIPLGGNRVLKWRLYYNLLITFLISGLWHGSKLTFLVWGFIHGFYLIFEKFVYNNKKLSFVYMNNCLPLKRVINTSTVFILVCFAWIFFRANSISEALFISKSLLNISFDFFLPQDADITSPVYAVISILVLLLIEFKREFLHDNKKLFNYYTKIPNLYKYIFLIFIILYIGVFNGSQFIYFQF
jgi:alginate O-acetyltransferase complex protein AlgI